MNANIERCFLKFFIQNVLVLIEYALTREKLLFFREKVGSETTLLPLVLSTM